MPLYAAVLDALLKHFNLEPIDPDHLIVMDSSKPDGATRIRRAFHGDRHRVDFDRAYTYAWIEKYRREAMAKSPDGCQSFFTKHEAALNRFGYSFHNMTALVYSAHTAHTLVPPMW
jgi:hypothetical protein